MNGIGFRSGFACFPTCLASYAIMLSVFASVGVAAYFVFFEKSGGAILLSAAFLLTAFIQPMLQYVVRHFCFLSTATVVEMLSYYEEDMETSLYLLMYTGIALIIIWLERAFYKWILKEKPERTSKMISPKNPVGLAMLIFFAALAVLSTILFILSGEYVAETFSRSESNMLLIFSAFCLPYSAPVERRSLWIRCGRETQQKRL